jgi:hypothetical protein
LDGLLEGGHVRIARVLPHKPDTHTQRPNHHDR